MDSPIAAVTLDATGTLLHSPDLTRIYCEVLSRHGCPVDADRLGPVLHEVWQEFDCRVHFGEERFGTHPDGARGWWAVFLERLAARLELPSPGPFAAAELFHRFAQGDSWEVFADVCPTLEALLEQGLELAVISNWDPRLPTLLESLGLSGYFSLVLTSAEAGVEKPHPEIFLQALALIGEEPGACLHIGNSRRADLEGALGVGMNALLLDRGGGGDLADLSGLPRLLAGRRKLAPGIEEDGPKGWKTGGDPDGADLGG